MASNFLKDARQISSKVIFEPNDGNLGEIYSILVRNNNANNIYMENYGLPIDDNGNITIYRKDVYDSGITTYNRLKKIGYFDGENKSISLNNYRFASKYSDGKYNIAYSSRYTTDSQGYVINPDTLERSPVVFTINLLPDIPTRIRFFEIIGSQSRGEYPTEFEISFVEPEDGYLGNSLYKVTNNTANPCIVDFGEYKIIDRIMTLRITRWSKPYSSVKIEYLGIDTVFDVSNNDLLIKYNFDVSIKSETNLDYGCKYSTCSLDTYNPSKSYGKMRRYKEKILDVGVGITTETEITNVGSILNIIDCLSTLEGYNTKMSLYVKTEFDIRYTYIGKFYISKVKFNTQTDTTTIEGEDIVSKLQVIPYLGLQFQLGVTSVTLYDVYYKVKELLYEDTDINIDIYDNKTALYLQDIVIDYPKYVSNNVWEFLDKISILGQLYIVADTNNENNDIIIISEV